MSLDYYKKVYEVVDKYLSFVLLNIEVALMLSKEGLTGKVTNLPDDIKILIGSIYIYGISATIKWNDSVLVNKPIFDDYTEFLKHFENCVCMTDFDLNIMNIDITDRMYTLLLKKIF